MSKFKGTVKFFGLNGWGFLIPDDGSEDVFIHHRGFRQTGFVLPKKGDRVEYEIEFYPPGKRAKDAVIIFD